MGRDSQAGATPTATATATAPAPTAGQLTKVPAADLGAALLPETSQLVAKATANRLPCAVKAKGTGRPQSCRESWSRHTWAVGTMTSHVSAEGAAQPLGGAGPPG